jgi:hypothetical protein
VLLALVPFRFCRYSQRTFHFPYFSVTQGLLDYADQKSWQVIEVMSERMPNSCDLARPMSHVDFQGELIHDALAFKELQLSCLCYLWNEKSHSRYLNSFYHPRTLPVYAQERET